MRKRNRRHVLVILVIACETFLSVHQISFGQSYASGEPTQQALQRCCGGGILGVVSCLPASPEEAEALQHCLDLYKTPACSPDESFDNDNIRALIDKALGRAAHEGHTGLAQLEKAQEIVRKWRERNETTSQNLNCAATGHYLFGRYIAANGGSTVPTELLHPFLFLLPSIYDLWKIVSLETVPRTGPGDPSLPDSRVLSWSYQGMLDGLADYFYPQP
jgi:hypothetical protein